MARKMKTDAKYFVFMLDVFMKIHYSFQTRLHFCEENNCIDLKRCAAAISRAVVTPAGIFEISLCICVAKALKYYNSL